MLSNPNWNIKHFVHVIKLWTAENHFPELGHFWGSECCVLPGFKQRWEMCLVVLWQISSSGEGHRWEWNSRPQKVIYVSVNVTAWQALKVFWSSRKHLKSHCVTFQMFVAPLKLADQPSAKKWGVLLSVTCCSFLGLWHFTGTGVHYKLPRNWQVMLFWAAPQRCSIIFDPSKVITPWWC